MTKFSQYKWKLPIKFTMKFQTRYKAKLINKTQQNRKVNQNYSEIQKHPVKESSNCKNSQSMEHIYSQFQTQVFMGFPELDKLHMQIMGIYNHYQKLRQSYNLGVKHKINETIYNGCNTDLNIQTERLRIAYLQENEEHKIIDQNFNNIFTTEYLENSMKSTLNEKTILQKSMESFQRPSKSQNKWSEKKRNDKMNAFTSQKQKVSVDFIIQSKQLRQDEINFELEKQKHANTILMNQIQLLQKQYHFLSHSQSEKLNQHSNAKQLQRQNSKDEQAQSQQDDESFIEEQDQQIQMQIELIKNLIKSKSSLSLQLQSSNRQIKSRINQLRSKQTYLEKSKTLYQSQFRTLQRKLDSLVQTIKSGVDDNSMKKVKCSEQYGLNRNSIAQQRQKLSNLAQSISQVKNLIDSSLAQWVFNDKLNQIHQEMD